MAAKIIYCSACHREIRFEDSARPELCPRCNNQLWEKPLEQKQSTAMLVVLRTRMLIILDELEREMKKFPRKHQERARCYWINTIKAAIGSSDFPHDVSIEKTIKEIENDKQD